MDYIHSEYKVAILFAVNHLKEESAPSSIGYNDMALMIAYGESSEYGIPTVNSDMISRFLLKHQAVPINARMLPQTVKIYLEKLATENLIDREINDGDYRMRNDTSTILVRSTDLLKSSDIDKTLFHGFRVYSAWEIYKQITSQKFEHGNLSFNH
ncbi:hypothetical protein HYW75_02130 [Candidatus Pacearchaeota archaeon]|nr:hypothetical protein [Candidatus Pacearchaeota archaeon]